MAKIRANWYKPSGKWYAQEDIEIPDDFEISYVFPKDSVQMLIERVQKQLQSAWINGDWYVAVTCLQQEDADTRFLERLYKYGNVK